MRYLITKLYIYVSLPPSLFFSLSPSLSLFLLPLSLSLSPPPSKKGDKLVSKSTFPESANNNEMARHLYYLGRIKATQLEYSAAHQHLMQVVINYRIHGNFHWKNISPSPATFVLIKHLVEKMFTSAINI